MFKTKAMEKLKEIENKLDNILKELWEMKNPPKYKKGDLLIVVDEMEKLKKTKVLSMHSSTKRGMWTEIRYWIYVFEGRSTHSMECLYKAEEEIFTDEDLKNV